MVIFCGLFLFLIIQLSIKEHVLCDTLMGNEHTQRRRKHHLIRANVTFSLQEQIQRFQGVSKKSRWKTSINVTEDGRTCANFPCSVTEVNKRCFLCPFCGVFPSLDVLLKIQWNCFMLLKQRT